MLPIRDHNPSNTTPIVTWGLMALNILIFIGYFGKFGNERELSQLFLSYGIVPAMVSEGFQYSTLITSQFLHGGILHLAGNMLFLWIFGDNLEDSLGHVGFLTFYLLSGIAAGLMQIAIAPYSTVPIVGASGAIAGVMGGYLLLFPRARIDVLLILIIYFRVFTISAWIVLGVWFGLPLFNGSADSGSGGGVAYWAHIGGFVAGAVLCIPLWLRRGGTAAWRSHAGHAPYPDTEYEYSNSRIPRVVRRPKSVRRKGPGGG